jgi:hypothetical protein
MHRDSMGRGHWIAAIAGAALIIACVLPWYTAGGGTEGLPALAERAFNGPGAVCFAVGLALIALVVLPYAARRRLAIDHWAAYLALTLVATAGWVAQLVTYLGRDLSGLRPDRAPGIFLVAIALVALYRAVFEIRSERD